MLYLVAIAVAVATLQAHAADVQTITARVVGVHDGDTLTALTDDKRQLKVRLHGIDAPKLGQPFGRVARDQLAALAKGKTATIHGNGNDRQGWLIASAEVEHDDVAHRLVAEGLAWHYARYSKDAGLAAAERDARAAGRELWADRALVPPREWQAGEKQR